MEDRGLTDNTIYEIFISYARPDEEVAISLFEWLQSHGFETWIDKKSIKPGQDWDFEIKRALDRSSFIIVLLSKNSYDRRGYVQREIKIALDKYNEKLVGDIFIIPVLLDDESSVPSNLKSIQYIHSSKANFESDIADSINMQIEKLGGERRQIQEEKDLFWSYKIKKEVWSGLPGYEFEFKHILLSSDTYRNLDEISEYIKGHFLAYLFQMRRNKLEQSSDAHSYAESEWSRTDTFDAQCEEPFIQNRVISIKYFVNWSAP